MQLQLTFRNVEKKENSKAVFEEMTEKVLPLLALSNAHTPELIGGIADPEESSFTRKREAKV